MTNNHNSNIFDTPILFLVFNRLDTTKLVFEQIRNIKPKILYIASDGPRKNRKDEVIKVSEVRSFIMDNIDWDCEIKTLFRNQNLGCKYAVSSAIDWFFDNVTQGIILEDDCVPNKSFFYYCQDLLNKYKNDFRIWQISGCNFQKEKIDDKSYYYSKFNHVWGWASWSSRWSHYDVEMTDYEEFNCNNVISNLISDTNERLFWSKIFNDVSKNKIDTWDYQWTYKVWCNNGLTALPNTNLITNIGFGLDATHSKDVYSSFANLKTAEIQFPLKSPKFIIRDSLADKHSVDVFNFTKSYLNRIKIKLSKLTRKYISKK